MIMGATKFPSMMGCSQADSEELAYEMGRIAADEVDPYLGLYPPATFSKRLLTDLLRHELGFEGLIISDAINMGGAVGFMRHYEGCAKFFESGGNMLLFPRIDEAYYVEMENLIKAGVLQIETLID